ncbi:MAG TPA: TIR domain-containing protein [Sphingomicrobium sp.]|nr:TIR domain-containing protein [Sphingomicrobium sp.]
MSRIFLSYSRENVDAAKQLADCISNSGHEVWWDRHLQGGSRFTNEIDRQLKESDAVVVLWSESSVQSAWVQDEAAEGRDSGRLVPVALGSAKPPLGFRQFHTVDLGSWSGEGKPDAIDDLLAAIESTCRSDSRTRKADSAETGKRAGKLSVCVLPFANMSGEPEQEYFSDGISEDIITDLSKVSALSVVARNTAFTFKGQSLDVKDVAKSLGVSHVLEGSVRKAGNRVRITAQLIDGAAGDHVWADRYDRDLDDIFAIQDEISKAIVQALQVKLLPKEKSAIESRGTSSVDAYNLYLMARQQWIGGSFGTYRDQAIVRICRQATALDPDYARAWALMALAQAELRFWHGKEESALPAAERALEIDPDLAEARCVKAHYLEEEGRQEEANKEIEQALKLDPESWEVNREAARMLFRQGRIAEAVPFFEKASALMDTDFHNPSMLLTCYQSLGDEQNRRRAAVIVRDRTERALAKDPTNALAAAYGASALAMLGDHQRAREWIERALLLDPDNLSMRYNLACALIVDLKDTDSALEVLEPFFEQVVSSTHIKHMDADPDFDSVRDHPRFNTMLAEAKARLGLSETPA